MVEVSYFERGTECNHKRVGDYLQRVTLRKTWESGGLLYGYKDRFNVVCIPKEDIVSIITDR